MEKKKAQWKGSKEIDKGTDYEPWKERIERFNKEQGLAVHPPNPIEDMRKSGEVQERETGREVKT